MTEPKRRVAITGLGLVTPVGNDVATTWNAVAHGRSGAAPITLFDASGFLDAHRRRSQGFRRGRRSSPIASSSSSPIARIASRSPRPSRQCATRASRRRRRPPTRWGCAVGTGMMGVAYDDLASVQRHSRGRWRAAPRRLLDDRRRDDPMVFCRSQSTAGLALLDAPLRHPRLCDVGAHRVRFRGQAIGTALKLIRRGASTSCWPADSTR